MPTKLSVFNQALQILGQTMLTSPDAEIESGRQLRAAWEAAVSYCYEVGAWTFISKRATLARNGGTPDFGYSYYYDLPSDYMRTLFISATGLMTDPLLDYQPENGMIATNAEAVYLRYVSRDLATLAPGNWSQAFADYVSANLAVRVAPKLNPSALEAASQTEQKNRIFALSSDAVKNPPARRRPGTFVQAVTMGSRFGNGEMG